MKKYNSEENFWKGKFGNKYILRNKNINQNNILGKYLKKNKIFPLSCIEFGANIGKNLDAVKAINKNCYTYGIEINNKAFRILIKNHQAENISINNYKIKKKFDLVISSKFLIHQNPTTLKKIYKLFYLSSNKYIFINEYFSPNPEKVIYRGHKNKLYKRDFAKEIWKMFPDLKLVDYGFEWKEDPLIGKNSDNSNWFLFKK